MKKVIVGFSKSKKHFAVGSWVIREVTGAPFSHVYVKHETRYGFPIIYQASGHQVNFMSQVMFCGKNEIIREFEFEIADEAFDDYMKFALENAGAPYSVWQLVGIGIALLFDLKKNPFSNGRGGYVCSELAGIILSGLEKIDLSDMDFDLMKPTDVYRWCISLENDRGRVMESPKGSNQSGH